MIRITSFEEEKIDLDLGGSVTHYPSLEDFHSTSSSTFSRSPLPPEMLHNLRSITRESADLLQEEENTESISSVRKRSRMLTALESIEEDNDSILKSFMFSLKRLFEDIEDTKISIVSDQEKQKLRQEKQVKKETQAEIKRLPEMVQTSPVFDTPITEETLECALLFINRFFELLRFFRHQLRKPHVATEGTGEVSLGWWYGDKSLTFFINPTGETEYLKAWGANIYNDMEEGFNPTDHQLIDLWRWLIQ
jgi:hypothetical protein